jgi:hypothetical protein
LEGSGRDTIPSLVGETEEIHEKSVRTANAGVSVTATLKRQVIILLVKAKADLRILSRALVTIDAVWIGNWIY